MIKFLNQIIYPAFINIEDMVFIIVNILILCHLSTALFI